MRLFHRSSALATVSVLAVLASTAAAQAGAFALREQSASAQGLSFAGAASGSGGLSSTFWNPATITMAPGWQSEGHISAIIPRAEIDPVPPTPTIAAGPSGDVGEDALVPSSYSSYQFNDRIWLGVASSSPFGLVTKPNTVWAGQVYSRSSQIFSLNVNPIIGIKVTDWLSIAAGPMLQYFDVRLKQAVPGTRDPRSALGAFAPSGFLEGDDYGVGFTAGVTITPFAGTAIGVGFRSSINHELEGVVVASPTVEIPVRAKLNTPEILTASLSQQITTDFKVHATFQWENWSRLGVSNVVGPFGQSVTDLRLNYKDGYFYAIGAEYQFTPRIALRAGLAYEDSPITERIRSTRLPDNDRIWASLGAQYKWSDKLTLDVSYTHIFVDDTRIRIVPGHQDYKPNLPFVAEVDSSVDIISAGFRYRFDTPVAAVVPAAPIVRKY